MTLRVVTCTEKLVRFGLTRTEISSGEHFFDFVFRYYVPFHGVGLNGGGLYVFKTSDSDSQPYNH